VPSARSVLLRFFRRVTRIYFREIEVVGHVPAAGTGGRIFAGNHTNGLVDPVLVLTNAPCPISTIGKSTLWKIPVLKWLLDAAEAVPIERRKDNPDKRAEANEAIFDRIADHLGRGGNVLIFPEGTSHNEPHVVPLKTGAARMLARARQRGATGLTFQAVGLEFDARDRFRSRALVVYGPVRSVDELALEGDALVEAITDRLREDLSELVVEGTSWEEYRLIARVAQLFANQSGDRTLATWNEIGRQVEEARRALGPEGEGLYREIARSVGEYYEALEAEGLSDEEVARGDGPPVRRRKRRALLLALALPLAVPGAVLYFVPYQLPRLVAARFAHGDRDVVSTLKVGTGLLAYPVWLAALLGATFAFLPLPLALAAAAVVVLSPFAALAWLDFLDRPRSRVPAGATHLTAMRRALSERLARARAHVEGRLEPQRIPSLQ
jgi:glycerol-3-phosphate O-acyltransferase / dihydroxyacetone phosphate acyltransferase